MIPHGARAGRGIAMACLRRKFIHSSSYQRAVTNFTMPAMSPTMTEGGIAQWKKAEGESFVGGDVLLEIETDKATIDVEAQDDGIVGKIIVPNGSKNIPVGKIIALLAQEGDDISNLEVPKEEASPSKEPEKTQTPSQPSNPAPQNASSSAPSTPSSHVHIESSRPLFPSVQRLLQENQVSSIENIKGTGIRGMITKGDLLAFLGKASGPNGTYKDNTPTPSIYKSQAVSSKTSSAPIKAPLDPTGIRQAILTAFMTDLVRRRTPLPTQGPSTIDSVIADYLPGAVKPKIANPDLVQAVQTASSDKYLDGLY